MSKRNFNPYLGSDLKSLIKEQLLNEEFAEAYELERERLRIAHKVKALREKKQMTQMQLAELVGTKQPSIARLEAGNYWPRIDMLEKIAWALGVQLDVRFVKKAA
jgi:DNA-binding XRE family transcriptional regulator